ncbi:hypothetical protein BDQ17DRAFT_1432886 [Cyathus striatus]|nr:hypothetical protein BDQ17DRAFT_1432886 [Cyathus striatus]
MAAPSQTCTDTRVDLAPELVWCSIGSQQLPSVCQCSGRLTPASSSEVPPSQRSMSQALLNDTANSTAVHHTWYQFQQLTFIRALLHSASSFRAVRSDPERNYGSTNLETLDGNGAVIGTSLFHGELQRSHSSPLPRRAACHVVRGDG